MNNRALRIAALVLAVPFAIPLGIVCGVIYLTGFGMGLWLNIIKAVMRAKP